MDKEIVFINNLLKESDEGLTTSEISKKIFEKHNLKVSRQIVKNYLWSYFRNIIKYDSSKYTYSLDNDKFLIDDVIVTKLQKSPRALSIEFEGPKINVKYDERKSKEDFIRALAILNFKSSNKKKNADLLKQINRIIEQTEVIDD